MATLKTIKRNHRSESLSGKFMIDAVRGVLRVRKWPKKRGTPKSASQLYWIDWFRQANKLAKYADAASMRRAIELTAGTGKYPRDIILQAMRGRLYTWVDENGKKWYPMAGVQDISDSLDVLAQDIGSVLVRMADRWRPVVLGDPGDVFTSGGPGVVPDFQPAAGGGGFQGGALAEKTGNQTIATGTEVALTWDAEDYDTAGCHDIVTNNSRMTVPAGTTWVQLSFGVLWGSNNTGSRILYFKKNGSAVFPGNRATRYLPRNSAQGMAMTPPLSVIAGDYFEAFVYQDSGSNRTVNSNEYSNFSMQLL